MRAKYGFRPPRTGRKTDAAGDDLVRSLSAHKIDLLKEQGRVYFKLSVPPKSNCFCLGRQTLRWLPKFKPMTLDSTTRAPICPVSITAKYACVRSGRAS